MSLASESGHVLVVEDEFLVAMHVEDVLADLGFADVHWANSLEAAERDLAKGLPRFAILDINIGPKLVFPFAEELDRRGVPFVFSSGGFRGAMPPQLAYHPFLSKPLDSKALAAIVGALFLAVPSGAQERAHTLGSLLYAKAVTPTPEREWEALVEAIAKGDELALYGLYQRSHRLVFTLITRMTHDRETAEELTIDVFHDIWRRAFDYDVTKTSVLGWIMSEARSRALNQIESPNNGDLGGDDRPAAELTADRQDAIESREDGTTARAQARLALRIGVESGRETVLPTAAQWSEPQWEGVAPGIECKLYATDTARHRVSMLVRLAPGASYPPHTHAGVEELHLLDGELWIDDRKLFPGDYHYAARGSRDQRVWSETGCTCVLVTSTEDTLH